MSHDLKTPMQALETEITTLASLLKRMRRIQRSAPTDHHDCDNDFEAIVSSSLESVQTLQDVNSFMLMTVNRNLDYTQASTGLTLMPSNSTIVVKEAITWAIDCVTRTCCSNVIPLLVEKQLSSFRSSEAARPCTHIITDYQWLVENILCLTSNAVKYTTEGGSIHVRYFLCAGADDDKKKCDTSQVLR